MPRHPDKALDSHTTGQRAATFYRRLQMLSLIPRHPGYTTARRLTEQLRARGFEVDKRTIERDLKAMVESLLVPLIYDDEQGGKENRWFWPHTAPRLEFPALPPATALSFLMVERFLKGVLPPVLHEQLQDYFAAARAVLKSEDAERRTLAAWPDKVRVVPWGQPLIAPEIPQPVLEGVYEALLRGRRFRARYRPRREEGAERDYTVNPIALVLRNHLIYLIATLWDYADIKHLALHRFRQVELLDQPSHVPEGFNLDRYLYASRAFDIPDPEGRRIKLVARFTQGAAYHLRETPLSEDQVIEDEGDGWVKITATVLETEQLEWWLRGFGDHVEVLGRDEA